MSTVIVQKWEEAELGWGTRPDGYSIHLSEPDRAAYVKNYWGTMPDTTPSEYSRPCGAPYEAEIDGDGYTALQASSSRGLRFSGNNYPGSGGKDGWMNLRAAS